MALFNGTGAVGGNAQNIPDAHVPRTYSTFPLKAHRLNTERFGEYTPIIAFESGKEDKLPFRHAYQLMSYTMKTPLMQDVIKRKDLFAVPMEAILPLNWEKFFVNPVDGDDIPNVDVGPCVVDFWLQVADMMSAFHGLLVSLLNSSSTSDAIALQAVLRFMILGEYFYSNGSLLATLGCKASNYYQIYDTQNPDDKYSWDKFFDEVCSYIKSSVSRFGLQQISIASYSVDVQDLKYHDDYVPFRHALSLMRDDLTCYIDGVVPVQSAGSVKNTLASLFQNFSFVFSRAEVPLNTEFLSAYQLCCAHYFSNDHVDFIYSAELFRQLIGFHLSRLSGYTNRFTRNGITYIYDFLSGHAYSKFLDVPSTNYPLVVQNQTGSGNDASRSKLGGLSTLFGFRRSLKFLDYFSGSRTKPLAVGTTTVDVSSGSPATVNVIDMVRGIQGARFLNAVNRVVHKFEGYLKAIYGGSLPAPDYHNPFKLATDSDSIYGDETANTGDAQLTSNGTGNDIAITTNLRGHGNNYMYEISSDRPCIIIAISSYDVPRVHLYSMDRQFLHVDRFDYFNPFLQYTGDQPVFLQELGIQSYLTTQLRNFGYQTKYSEFKQLYNTASGGFVENLPGWCFPAVDRRGTLTQLNPEWIRCIQSEFDYFYTSLTGYSLGSYFHFIVDNFVDFSGKRPMAFAPNILA